MTTILQRSAAFVGDVNKTSREVTFVASTESVDRYTEIIKLKAWNTKSLARFGAHGKILANHKYSQWPLARAREARIDESKKALVITARFPAEGKYKESDEVWSRLMDPPEERTLDESSVGFLPHNSGRYPTEAEMKQQSIPPWAYIYDTEGSLELLELSVVTVPANPEATLVTNSVAELLQSPDAKSMLETIIRETCDKRMSKVHNIETKLDRFFALLEGKGMIQRGSTQAAQGANAQKRGGNSAGSYGSEIEQIIAPKDTDSILRALQQITT